MLEHIYTTTVLYLLLIIGVRLLGKRQVGQMEPSEFVVTILIANLASIPMAAPDLSIWHGLVPMAIVVGGELGFSLLSMSSVGFRRVLCGKPVILIKNGHILQKELRRNRISIDELTSQLRLKDVLDLNTVQYAILETNGSLSVFLYPAHLPATAKDAKIQAGKQNLPITIIDDGKLLVQNLPLAKKDENWVHRVLRPHNASVADTFLLTVDASDHILWLGKER